MCCGIGGSRHNDDDESDVEWDAERQEVVYPTGKYDIVDTNSNSSGGDDTVIGEKQGAGSPRLGRNVAGGVGGGHKREVSLVSTDFGTPIIDKNGESTYVDQRLDVGRFEEEEDVESLNDGQDYSRKVLKVTNP